MTTTADSVGAVCGDKAGTVPGYVRHQSEGERACLECRQAWNRYQRQWRAERRARGIPTDPARHGTPYMYNLGCRCSICRTGNSSCRRADWRRRYPQAEPADPRRIAAIQDRLRALSDLTATSPAHLLAERDALIVAGFQAGLSGPTMARDAGLHPRYVYSIRSRARRPPRRLVTADGEPVGLTAEKVAMARRLYAAGDVTQEELANLLGVSLRTVRGALFGASWASVTDPPPLTPAAPGRYRRTLRRGTTYGSSLSSGLVAYARRAVADGRRVSELARELSIHHDTLARAVYGVTWTSLTDPPPLPRRRVPARARRVGRLSRQQVAEARRLYAAGRATKRSLAARYGVGQDTIREAIHGVTWQDITDPPPVPR